jgi:hypothetical protein
MYYFPIPEGLVKSKSVTASLPKNTCNAAVSSTQSWSVNIPKSATAREKMPNVVIFERNAPTEGKWRQIKDSGHIKMTEMSIRNEHHTFDIVGVERPVYRFAWAGTGQTRGGSGCPLCAVKIVKRVFDNLQERYVEQGDLSYWKERYPGVPHYKCMPYFCPVKVEHRKAAVISDLFQAYNLGEEIYELRSSLSTVTKLATEGVSLILKSRKFITSLVERGLHKEAAKRWMEFRYGIMPIIYSIQDVLTLKNETGRYRTIRKSVTPDEPEEIEPGSEPVYFYDQGAALLRCSVMAKARWASQEMKQLDLINVNPITTAFEVYPWAMVVRWFVNVSTFINSRIKSLTSLALQHRACCAVREKMEYGTYLHLEDGYEHTHYTAGHAPPCPDHWYGEETHGPFVDHVEYDSLLAWYSINNYTRYLFTPQDVKLVFRPMMNWKRYVDGLIMGSGQLSKSLRRLK